MKNLFFTFMFIWELGNLSCTAQSLDTYPATIFPNDTSQLWLSTGIAESDTVLIFCQGGPHNFLYFQRDGRSSWRYLPQYERCMVVHLHQAQTYNPEIYAYKDTFTLAMARQEVANTSEMLHRAITYFKNRNKRVIVIGHSYGAFVIANYLANYPSQADKYIISGGRIEVPLAMVKDHLKGVHGSFAKDGLTYLPYEEEDISQYSEAENKIYRAKSLLKAAIGQIRYSQALANQDLSKVIYFYAHNDENVGALNDSEISFLKSRNAQVYKTYDGHGHIYRRIIDAVREGKLVL